MLWNSFVYFISCIFLARPFGVWYGKSERQGGQWCQRDRGLGWRPRPPPTQPTRRQVSRTRAGGWDTFGDAMRVPNLFQLWTRTLHCGVSVAIFATRAMSNHFSIGSSRALALNQLPTTRDVVNYVRLLAGEAKSERATTACLRKAAETVIAIWSSEGMYTHNLTTKCSSEDQAGLWTVSLIEKKTPKKAQGHKNETRSLQRKCFQQAVWHRPLPLQISPALQLLDIKPRSTRSCISSRPKRSSADGIWWRSLRGDEPTP